MKAVSTLVGVLSMMAIAVAQPTSPQNISTPNHLEVRNAYEAVIEFYFDSAQCNGRSQSFTVGNLNECHNLAAGAISVQVVTVGSHFNQNVLYLRSIQNCGWSGDQSQRRFPFNELNIPGNCITGSGPFEATSFFLEST
ncbi:hypothetical protein H2200_000630 [Cladophialophora chaetospira]|uniref:AA1-like domain-containing protein n=1 Tax=Cladophialophora chaetospira TaxID=386627 RepID=A0AA38XNT5_9EURO|nr:hypothetical protein H2200_000630 [Cladophialophora chaetospira]